MSIEDDIALLERVPTLAVLGREALRILAIGAESHPVEEGAVLFKAGDKAEGGYIVETGSFRLVPPNGEPGTVAARGTLLGELALLTETRRPATAQAQELSSVMRIPRPLFLKMLDGYPDVAERLRRALQDRVHELEGGLQSVRDAFVIDEGHPLYAAMQAARAAKPPAAVDDGAPSVGSEKPSPTE
jgi:CRP-like cAMP-binding protein